MNNPGRAQLGDDPFAQFAASVAKEATEIDPATLQAAMSALHRYLRGKFPVIRADDLDDLAAEAVTRVVAKARTGSIRSHPNPAGYLVRTAEHLALDYLRSARHNREVATIEELPESRLTDAQAAAALDSRANVELVHAVLRRIQCSQDTTLFQITTYLLNEIQQTGVVPSNRKTARACQVSHTAVAKALQRLRNHFTALSKHS